MAEFNPGGALNALAGIAKVADKLPSPGTPATTPQRPASAPAPKPVAQATRGAPVRPGVHPEDRSARHADGQHAKPTKAPLQARPSSPSAYNTSGIEQSMDQLADRLHKPVHGYANRKRKG